MKREEKSVEGVRLGTVIFLGSPQEKAYCNNLRVCYGRAEKSLPPKAKKAGGGGRHLYNISSLILLRHAVFFFIPVCAIGGSSSRYKSPAPSEYTGVRGRTHKPRADQICPTPRLCLPPKNVMYILTYSLTTRFFIRMTAYTFHSASLLMSSISNIF